MTNEEAIKRFETLLLHVDTDCVMGMETTEAINMAIEALKAQDVTDTNVGSNGDTIYRQAAINTVVFECGEWTGLAKEISKQLRQMPSAHPDTDRIYAELSKAYNVKGLPDEAICIIGDLMLSLDALSAQPKQDREFVKLTVRNSNGRPYYSIIYLEFDDNGVGHDFEGYSSYSLDVISDYLKKYFMPSAQPEIIRCGQCKYAEVAAKEDAQDGYTCQFHRGSVWFSGSYCSWAERRTDDESI